MLAHDPGVVASVNVTVAVPHASLAVGELNVGAAGQEIVEGPPTPVNVGGILSITVMACEAVVILLQPSVAVHVLVTV